MSKKSLLLSLDGSAQSRYAAELVWEMSKAGSYKVEAQHVVDSLAAWDFLNFDIAGFIGSGPYFEAHETMRNCLQSIGENLVDAYQVQAKSLGIEGECNLDDGTTIREICWRAKDVDLVAIGQRSTGVESAKEDKRVLPRRSIAETLAYYCPKPMLVLMDRCPMPKRLKIMLSELRIPSSLIASCLDFAKNLNLEVELCLLIVTAERSSAESAEREAKQLLEDLQKLLPGLAKFKTDVVHTESLDNYWKEDLESEQSEGSLIVVPVASYGGIRKTCFGTAPDVLIRYQNHPCMLFWMDEEIVAESSAARAASTTTA